MRKIAVATLLASSLLASVPASAATLLSLDRATFQAAIAGSTTLGIQNFDSLPLGTLTSDGTVTYSSSTGTPVVQNTFLPSTAPNSLGRSDINFFTSADTATFTFTTAITAFAIDVNTFATAPGSFLGTLNTGDTVNSIFETFPGFGTGQFIGFVSDTPFTSLTVSAPGQFAYTLDTLIYGAREQVTGGVPEPTTWALMILGFAMVGSAMRRGRKPAVRVHFA